MPFSWPTYLYTVWGAQMHEYSSNLIFNYTETSSNVKIMSIFEIKYAYNFNETSLNLNFL